MKIVVMIPSRYGSTRFEGKPLALISGKPMIQCVYERAVTAEMVDDVVVATDDRRIYRAVTSFGGKAIMTAAENRSGTDRVAEAAELLNLSANDIVVNIQGDQPRIHPSCIQEVAAPLIENPDIQMSTLAFKITNPEEITNPKDVKVTFDTRGDALYFSRSPIPFGRDPLSVFNTYKHLGVYAYTRRFLDVFRSLPDGRLENIEKLEQLRAMEYGYRIRVVVTEHDSPEVDVPEDINRIQNLLIP
ncbi:MAG: 3-deoxy-manno-octulosonate cytidylyltransferase [Deltaproteobacteria bacterium]|nr:3-deoxy-manno-octulosonate cytidylyltransferase [Deltaproteobacteria bacterium]